MSLLNIGQISYCCCCLLFFSFSSYYWDDDKWLAGDITVMTMSWTEIQGICLFLLNGCVSLRNPAPQSWTSVFLSVK